MASSPAHAFFTNIPWTSHLLAAPNLTITTPSSRTPKPHTGEDSLFAHTLATPTTIPHCLVYYPHPATSSEEVTAITVLLQIEDACNGFPSILHGGITATLLDESMGILLQVIAEREHAASVAAGDAKGDKRPGVEAMTKGLNVQFKAPVRTPGVVVVRVKVVEKRGRGISLVASVLQKEGSGDGLVECARGEGVFVTPRGAGHRL
ncbi:hypothetical protein AUEXF2481DRAFT_28709 [Aureobasidium subglaciale EXF-2481]|uniref:Thioesterase domain-containing protein n=1 Tax=Aureobasidium subglaciale (strain EXF-2481) TaxID=1043005 RepID=A0A074YDV4_AURSE|nr:uncharacterized protein AUEXF2481DRAFT_28709 [Aureobasidium subglaciale EXF-2481]KAI5210941.1 hypothetical protein E4T38_01608 [Aureobasidium subglaciale]KAI5219124.1 hypothetical protein E4T40_06541 [Aureobasidium subglaciale]KAI5233262.1 hypothetical protein E4T41_01606 [Aureobasidium subglaciale]KAI5260093.1 hypothetical protein E4T46_06341 [Aureobasidium subglaciale]KEQ95993.1 hypothetical protein AUEXF2481DRAFT_28709 [Aureobasidium subglaciale EXF-2481]